MDLQDRKKRIIERLHEVENDTLLNQVEQLLIQEEMQRRYREAVEDANAGRTISVDDFSRRNKEWLKK
ncbi:MAG: hypothetical protein ACFB10_20540 [Salibacteraceae bacterium]